jgi:beta-lactamase superfamily II metal-dependent hydrolase
MSFLDHLKPETLAIIVINVGDGDAIIIRFPYAYGKNACSIVDCYNSGKMINILEQLDVEYIPFICATHPHADHIMGIPTLIDWCLNKKKIPIGQYWDSGFRHVSKTHYRIIRLFQEKTNVDFILPTSGYQCFINRVKITVLSPSIHLRNRYDTFGTNINNASIVMKLEYPPDDIALPFSPDESSPTLEKTSKKNTVILGGDAQFDAWARITEEFPRLERTKNIGQMINASVVSNNPLRCQLLKMPHHMSKHSISLEVLEILNPGITVSSCSSSSEYGFPHALTEMAVDEVSKSKKSTYKYFTGHKAEGMSSGTVVAFFDGDGGIPTIVTCGESADIMIFP